MGKKDTLAKMIPPALTVQIESGEKADLAFPKWLSWYPENILSPLTRGALHRIEISVEKIHFPTGDYRFKEYPTVVGAERKCGLQEIGAAFAGHDRTRVANQLSRMVGTYQYPILYLEISLAELFGQYRGTSSSERVMDRVFHTATLGGLILTFAPGGTRTKVSKLRKGTLLLRQMLSYLAQANMVGTRLTREAESHLKMCSSIMGGVQ